MGGGVREYKTLGTFIRSWSLSQQKVEQAQFREGKYPEDILPQFWLPWSLQRRILT